MEKQKPLILAITAASGFIYGVRTLEYLLKNDYSVELIISEKAYYIAKHEHAIDLSHSSKEIKQTLLAYIGLEAKADSLKIWLNDEIWANVASGSYQNMGMIITPTSMSTLAAISCGLSDNLIERAADVMLKEGRKLVIVPRETPFSTIHLENMLKLSKMGVKIVPPIPGFYNGADSLEDMINFVVGKTLDAFGIENDLYKRWNI